MCDTRFLLINNLQDKLHQVEKTLIMSINTFT